MGAAEMLVASSHGTVVVPFYERGCQEKQFSLGLVAAGGSSLGIQPLFRFGWLVGPAPDRWYEWRRPERGAHFRRSEFHPTVATTSAVTEA